MKLVIVAHNSVVWNEVEFSPEDLTTEVGIKSILLDVKDELERLRDKDAEGGGTRRQADPTVDVRDDGTPIPGTESPPITEEEREDYRLSNPDRKDQ